MLIPSAIRRWITGPKSSSPTAELMTAHRGRSVSMEVLESRILFSMNPTGMEQEMLEMVNRMRMSPQEELDRIFLSTTPGDPDYFRTGDPDVDAALSYFGVDDATLFSQWASLSPTAPLAWNEALMDAARNHSNRMMLQDLQSHQLPGDLTLGLPAEPSLLNRVVDAGYDWSGSVSVGENVFAYAESIFHSHVAFAIDWGNTQTGIQSPPGHRENMMDNTYREIGIGVISDSDPSTSVGPLLVTQDFGVRGNYGNPRLLGVVFDDADTDGDYDAGEGLGGLTITIQNGPASYQTTTMSAGGYQLELSPGTYTVTAAGTGLNGVVSMGTVTIGSYNEKLDLNAAALPTQGAIGGTVFQDADQDGQRDTGDTGLAGFTVFADADRDGVLDPSETLDVTDANGSFLLSDLTPGNWSVRVVGQSNYRSTTPDAYSVDVSAGGMNSSSAFGQFRFLTTTGNTVFLHGTPDTDQFEWRAGASEHTVTLNGSTYQFSAATYRNFVLNGLVGSDSVSLHGGLNTDTVNFDRYQVTLTDGVYSVYSSQVVNAVVDAGPGALQRAYFLDSTGDDNFTRDSAAATLTAANFMNRATGFDRTYATSSRGGQDQAHLYDGSGEDFFTGRETYASLWAADSGFLTRVDGFSSVTASSQGGGDTAYLHDSASIDYLTARPDYAVLWSGNGTFSNRAEGFGLTIAYSTAGGSDQAYLYDGTGHDRFVGRSDYSTMSDVGNTFHHRAEGFEKVLGYASSGTDYAELYDSTQDDFFTGRADYSVMWAANNSYSNRVEGFDEVEARATAGGKDVAYLHDSSSQDTLTGGPAWTQMTDDAGTYLNRAHAFEFVYGNSTLGGNDVALLSGSAGNDTFEAYPTYAILSASSTPYFVQANGFHRVTAMAAGSGFDRAAMYDSASNDFFTGRPTAAAMWAADYAYTNRAEGFDRVTAHATSGGNDFAYLYDSAGVDYLTARPDYAALWAANDSYTNRAEGFDRTYAYATAGGADQAYLYDSAGNDTFVGRSDYSTISDSAGTFYHHAEGFRKVLGYASAGSDHADLFDSQGNDFFTGRSDYSVMWAADNSYSNRVSGFDRVAARGGAGGNDVAYLHDSAGNDSLYGRNNFAFLSGVGFENRVFDFQQVYAYSTRGGSDTSDVANVDYFFEQFGNWL